MSRQERDYGEDFVDVKRSSGGGYEDEREYHSALRRSQRERADSVSFTPQDSYGRPTLSEASNSGDEMAYFSTEHHQFESSFRSVRGRERAPLAPRLQDMRIAAHAQDGAHDVEEPQSNSYDNDVENQALQPEKQELAIIEDILSLLIGVSGRYISFRHAVHSTDWRLPLSIEDALIAPMWISPTLAQMANKILPLVLMHRRIEYFTTTYAQRQAGVVNQALCAAIRTVLKDYYTTISTLENLERTSIDTSPYTLQKMWLHLYPQMQIFERLVHLVDAIQEMDLPRQDSGPAEAIQREDDGFGTLADKHNLGSDSGDPLPNDDGMAESEYSDGDDEPREIKEMFVVRGGHTLNIISGLIQRRGGESATRQLYEFLLTKASVPFLEMLGHWLRTGELEDSKAERPGGEFMVASDNDGVSARTFIGAEYIDDVDSQLQRDTRRLGFVSVPKLTPAFLLPYATKIVRTGEYLNILRACGVDLRILDQPGSRSMAPGDGGGGAAANALARPEQAAGDGEMSGLLNPQQLMRQTDQAYLRANQALLDILFKDGKMMEYMGAAKRYYLFEKSDFLTHFLDLAKAEMNRKPQDISTRRLQSFLDLALLNPASVSHDDPLKDIVRVSLEQMDLIDTLQIINNRGRPNDASMLMATTQRLARDNASAASTASASTVHASEDLLSPNLVVALQLQVPFPYTVVLDKVALNKYKALSRLLLLLKQTEQNLVASWLINLKLEDPPVSPQGKDAKLASIRRMVFLRVHTTRHRILMSVQQILHYCFWDVIEPQWERMAKLMKSAKTVDELCKVHKHHLDLIFQQCGLTVYKLPKIIVELLRRANKFTSAVHSLMSKPAYFPVAGSAASKNTVSGQILGRMHGGSLDPETQCKELQSVFTKLEILDKEWANQLRTLINGLNHYARKFEESYLTLAVRLDCNRDEDTGSHSR
ncbi:gamma tubulin complex Spc97/GCP2 subunit Alp4 [Coemansia sp. RSA 2618]|nr:gamma tubulin complex Spc97/GCP2 subunit Alp4 [Coemansia sp. RSA 2618]